MKGDDLESLIIHSLCIDGTHVSYFMLHGNSINFASKYLKFLIRGNTCTWGYVTRFWNSLKTQGDHHGGELPVHDNVTSTLTNVAPCEACRPWIFFINGVLCFLKINGSGMEKEER